MANRILSIILFLCAGALLGVTVISNQMREPQLELIAQKQTEILTSVQKLEAKLDSIDTQGKVFNTALQAAQARLAPQAAAQEPPSEDFSTVYSIPVDHSPVFGKKDAPVTLVEFVDFQCPFCARFHDPLVQAVKASGGKANYIIKNFPLSFHPMARPTAKAVMAAGEQGKYYEMADAILEDNSNLSEDKIKDIAKKVGLNVDKFMKDWKDKDAQWEDYINKDLSLGQQVQVQGTPTFYINGRKTMARDADSFKREIDAASGK
jgi:protein-disulfide isomerase